MGTVGGSARGVGLASAGIEAEELEQEPSLDKMLDLDDPTKVTHRTPKPIYEPVADYETQGIYKGVCFPCGHVVIDGTYFLYYGGGDVHCAVCITPLQDLIDHLLENPVK